MLAQLRSLVTFEFVTGRGSILQDVADNTCSSFRPYSRHFSSLRWKNSRGMERKNNISGRCRVFFLKPTAVTLMLNIDALKEITTVFVMQEIFENST